MSARQIEVGYTYICVFRGKFVKSINSLRFTSLFSKVLSFLYMVSKSCVKYASMLGNCVV